MMTDKEMNTFISSEPINYKQYDNNLKKFLMNNPELLFPPISFVQEFKEDVEKTKEDD